MYSFCLRMGFLRYLDHEKGIGEERHTNDMENVQTSYKGPIGFDELPKKPLDTVKDNKKIKTVTAKQTGCMSEALNEHHQKDQHSERFVQLDRVAVHTVAEVPPPRQNGLGSIGKI